MYNILSDGATFKDAYKILQNDLMFEDGVYDTSCEVGVDNSCQQLNEICVQQRERSRNGLLFLFIRDGTMRRVFW